MRTKQELLEYINDVAKNFIESKNTEQVEMTLKGIVNYVYNNEESEIGKEIAESDITCQICDFIKIKYDLYLIFKKWDNIFKDDSTFDKILYNMEIDIQKSDLDMLTEIENNN